MDSFAPSKHSKSCAMLIILVTLFPGCRNKEQALPPAKPAKASQPQAPTDPQPIYDSIAAAYIANDFDSAAELTEGVNLDDLMPTELLFYIGEIEFAAGRPQRSVQAYDRILDARPDLKPQLWQRGLALYYAGDFQGGVEQLESHQQYNSQDVENSVWHLMMAAKVSSVETARQGMIPITRDGRVPMKEVFGMFAGTGSPAAVLDACHFDETDGRPDSAIYHGWLYIGLYHEMLGDEKASVAAMEQAVKFNPLTSGLMAHIAKTHLRLRKKK